MRMWVLDTVTVSVFIVFLAEINRIVSLLFILGRAANERARCSGNAHGADGGLELASRDGRNASGSSGRLRKRNDTVVRLEIGKEQR